MKNTFLQDILDFYTYRNLCKLYGHLFTTINFSAGEIFELKAELNSDKRDKKKEAVKKVIASMTVGKDVRYVVREESPHTGYPETTNITWNNYCE